MAPLSNHFLSYWYSLSHLGYCHISGHQSSLRRAFYLLTIITFYIILFFIQRYNRKKGGHYGFYLVCHNDLNRLCRLDNQYKADKFRGAFGQRSIILLCRRYRHLVAHPPVRGNITINMVKFLNNSQIQGPAGPFFF